MSIDLYGSGTFSMHWCMWRELFDLSSTFGWEPEGTIRNPYPGDEFQIFNVLEDQRDLSSLERSGYFSNDGDLVTTTDAAAWAAALQGALVSKDSPRVQKSLTSHWQNEEFARRFICFCRAGPFIIL